MTKRKLRNAGTRPKAIFGSQEAAILAAAGINAATQLTAAGINSAAMKDSAKEQAEASIAAAQRQAQAIKDQTAKSKEYQTLSQEFIKDQNEENRQLQRDIQMQLQMLTGQQNTNDRLEASKIKVKAGGKTRKLGLPTSLLRGGNMPFQVTDGGGVLPVGRTPEGFDLYEMIGNDHEHYHKTRGKYKSGVGIKFADGNIVEGEGNQNTNQGELMLVTPDNAYFISKHSIGGLTPAKLVEQGIHPLKAFNIQEQAKAIEGIKDDGSKAKFGKKKFLIGGTPNLYDYASQLSPQVGTDTIGDTSVGIAYGVRRLRNGGSSRPKAYIGQNIAGNLANQWWNSLSFNDKMQYLANSPQNISTPNVNASTTKITPSSFTHIGNTNSPAQTTTVNPSTRSGFGHWVSNNADWLGAGIGALGNLGGALITSSANKSAARTLADAYNRSAGIISDAYNSLTGIDMNTIDRENYRAAHMMPALQAPVSFAASNIAGVNRSLQRRLRNAGRYSMSSAAAQDRMANAEVESQDTRNRIYNADQQQMQEIRQKNAERVSEASRINAILDTEANNQFGKDYLNLLQYNNDIANTRILGSAGALSEGNINATNAIATARTSNAQAWANALTGSTQGFMNTLTSMAKRRADLNNVLLGANTEAQVRYLGLNGSKREKDEYTKRFKSAIDSGTLSDRDVATYRRYIQWLS